MPINMIGWSVVYENQVYKCLLVEPIFDGSGRDKDGFERPVTLRVSVIDHDANFIIIDHYASRFKFLREAPPHE